MKKIFDDLATNLLCDLELRKILNTDIYQTKNYIFTEYHLISSSLNARIYYLFKNFKYDEEVQFYLNLDTLTYLPFERLGYEYLSERLKAQGSTVEEFKYAKIIEVLNHCCESVNEEAKSKVNAFLNNYYNDVVNIDASGFAIIALRLYHRFVLMMNFGAPLASLSINRKMDKILDKIIEDVNKDNLKQININDYLPAFDYSNQLSEDMLSYLELCLQRTTYNFD